MAVHVSVTQRASMGGSAIMMGAQTCVKMLNPAVSQDALPLRRTTTAPAEMTEERLMEKAAKGN